ncbi:MAG: hypothetical protein IPM54_38375 [Polyangiaceae bacterium]|nr:hypothetical protein [Polyangiaceae bacterium]
MSNLKSTVERVNGAVTQAGRAAWLVAYDINGIQQLVTSSNRPIAMRGASRTIQRFDNEQAAHELSIFAGGGRGYTLARSKDEAQNRIAQLQREFRELTISGVLAADAVPYDYTRPHESLVWLRRKLDNAKDAARPPGGVLPANKDEQCEDCHTLRAERTINAGDDLRRICARCDNFIKHARKDDPAFKKSLLDYANQEDGTLAAVSADGNNMGALFGMLRTLEQMAVVSVAVARIFESAHEQAVGANDRKILAPVTGGDDIRAFMAPELVLDYVEALARGIEDGARTAGDLDGVLSSRAQVEAFKNIGIGIGAAIAWAHYPASALLNHAHMLERRAKAICRDANGSRSAFDFAILKSEDPAHENRQVMPMSMEQTVWRKAIDAGQALRNVPSAQRAMLSERFTISSREEHDNLIRYQVARSKAWQVWFGHCRVDWTDPDELHRHIVATRLDLLDLLPRPKDPNA